MTRRAKQQTGRAQGWSPGKMGCNLAMPADGSVISGCKKLFHIKSLSFVWKG